MHTEDVIQIDIAKSNARTAIDEQVVVFTLDKEKYGIHISFVKEIMKWSKTTQLPQMPDELSGIIKLRDQVIPVISLRRQFGLPDADNLANTKIIMLENDMMAVGINVDDVDAVLHVPKSAIDFPSGLAVKADIIHGIAKLEDYLLILLDTETLFSAGIIRQA